MFKFDHVHLVCLDLERMERFLVDALGGRLVRRRETNGFRNWEYALDGVAVFLRERQPGEVFADGFVRRPGADHIGLGVDDIGAAVDRLVAAGCVLEEGPVAWRPDLTFAYLRGPENILVELLERH